MVTRTATRSATHLVGPAAEVPINAAVPTARAEVDIVTEAVVGAIGEAVPPPYV